MALYSNVKMAILKAVCDVVGTFPAQQRPRLGLEESVTYFVRCTSAVRYNMNEPMELIWKTMVLYDLAPLAYTKEELREVQKNGWPGVWLQPPYVQAVEFLLRRLEPDG